MRNQENHNTTVGEGRGRIGRRRGFTLLEVMTSLVILAFVSSSVLLVINRSILSAADSTFRLEAFRVARENMELLLLGNVASEMVEYGTSERYPGVSWRTRVEMFSEPISGQMWARAVCSAEYIDSTGETQTVELVKWLSRLTEQQTSQLMDESGYDLDALATEQRLQYIESAAQYAGVEPETIEQWLESGLVTTPDGAFLKYNLDIFVRAEGDPSSEQIAEQVATVEELAMVLTERWEDGDAADDAESR